jgi:1-acyl-sn-glycerol-3-phosphate acyltransferase
MLSRLSALILRLWGWKITGQYPHEIKKVIVIAAPHTSSWDFPIGVLVNSAWKCNANYVGKHTLFGPPFGFFFRWLGGIPVDRSKSHNFVAAMVDVFKTNERVHLVIAPEGKRKKVDKLKTGFYHIARLADVPICMCTFDWEHKIVHFDPQFFHTTSNEEADLAWVWNYYKGVKGKIPEWGIV